MKKLLTIILLVLLVNTAVAQDAWVEGQVMVRSDRAAHVAAKFGLEHAELTFGTFSDDMTQGGVMAGWSNTKLFVESGDWDFGIRGSMAAGDGYGEEFDLGLQIGFGGTIPEETMTGYLAGDVAWSGRDNIMFRILVDLTFKPVEWFHFGGSLMFEHAPGAVTDLWIAIRHAPTALQLRLGMIMPSFGDPTDSQGMPVWWSRGADVGTTLEDTIVYGIVEVKF